MKIKTKLVAQRQAKRWAYEEHLELMCKLPEEIKDHIDWFGVANALGIACPQLSHSEIQGALQRILDYVFEDEAVDYSTLENYLKPGHIFEAILAVQRWLNTERLG